ncbi:MAG: hypothetical protein VKL39_06675 [Leptolyngbyaceae bacterium]|nr:hypothetical protein [Leptolyngbyaceae bacterium]
MSTPALTDCFFYVVRLVATKSKEDPLKAEPVYNGISFPELSELYTAKQVKDTDYYAASKEKQFEYLYAYQNISLTTKVDKGEPVSHPYYYQGKVSGLSDSFTRFEREERQESSFGRAIWLVDRASSFLVVAAITFCIFGGPEANDDVMRHYLLFYEGDDFRKLFFGKNTCLVTYSIGLGLVLSLTMRCFYYIKYGHIRYGDIKAHDSSVVVYLTGLICTAFWWWSSLPS